MANCVHMRQMSYRAAGNFVHFIFFILFTNADLFSINIYYIIRALSLNYCCTIHTHTLKQVKQGNLATLKAGVS